MGTELQKENIMTNQLQSRYFDRLGITQPEVQESPSQENLAKIVEAHLARITFDNLSQHGLPLWPTLNTTKTAQKILEEKRGGFCYEVNGLLAELLVELGYPVKRVPAIIHAETGFRDISTHVILVVTASGKDWYVDVGLGEPPLHPLKYELNTEQVTPEGMESRIVLQSCPGGGETTTTKKTDSMVAILEWKKGQDWLPRLKWDFDHPGQDLKDFKDGLDYTLGNTSIFHKKLIVCKITRDEKLTLSGTRLKRTTPRFGPNSRVTVEELESDEDIQRVLEEKFGLSDASPLDLSKSRAAEPAIWGHLI